MKRFYKQAEAGTAPGGHTVRLDGKALRTPLQHPFILPTAALAAAAAAEWQAQAGDISPADMPLNQLANTMIDKGRGDDRAAMNAEMLKYAGSDLVCYYATHPAELVARQESLWHPLLGWLHDAHGVILRPVSGIRYEEQPAESLQMMEKIVAGLPPDDFTVAQAAMGLTGSAVIGLALASGRISADQAFAAATVDEAFQLEKWGEDEIARKKLDRLRAELTVLEKFRFLVKASL